MSFAIKFQFSDNDVFRRGKGDRQVVDIENSSTSHSPELERVGPHEIDVGFQHAMLADDIKMPATATKEFGFDYFGGR